MKVLVTFPRFGSTWIQKHINHYNHQFGHKDLYDYFGRKNTSTLETKIRFLEEERARGQEYSIKYFTYHAPVYTPWFSNFYRNYEIVKLKRNDTYSAYLSYLTQYATGWKYHNAKSLEERDKYDSECNKLIIGQNAIDEWFERYRSFIHFRNYHTEIIYEDYVPENESVTNTIPYKIDYEARILNIDIVKKEYLKCMKLLS